MQGKATLFGHSIHPLLIAFPIGLLGVVPIMDVIGFATTDARWRSLSLWLLSFGLIAAIVAAIPGLIDFLSIPKGTRARRVGYTHLGVNSAAMSLFIISWFVRQAPGAVASAVPFLLALAGLGVALVGSWLGAELVEQHGMSVREGAHVNAPSSLDEGRLVRRSPTVRLDRPIDDLIK
jgi:uncharacterized membrane protein